MKDLPDETTLLELLDFAKDAERKARKLHEMGEEFNRRWEQRSERKAIDFGKSKKNRASNLGRDGEDVS